MNVWGRCGGNTEDITDPQPEPMEVSKELLARRKVNTAINNKKIKYIEMVNAIEDQRLIHNIINHPIMGWRRRNK